MVFAFNNANTLIFAENYTETSSGSTNVVFSTPFYRNSHLLWFNGALLRPGTDYTMPGSAALTYNYTIIGALSFSGQPSQYMSFNSAGEASASSLSSAAVLGMDYPVVIEQEPTINDMFKDMQKQINLLKKQIKQLKGFK